MKIFLAIVMTFVLAGDALAASRCKNEKGQFITCPSIRSKAATEQLKGRCRDKKSGRFVSMENAKKNPSAVVCGGF